jgi:SAM-dependent methyltransferase
MNKSVIDFWYPEHKLLGFTRQDATILFYDIIHFLIQGKKDIVLVDMGCGRGEHSDASESKARKFATDKRNFKGRVQKVIGLDVDEAGATNPTIDEFHLIKPNEKLPLPDGCCDIIVCDYVVEHITTPDHFFAEINRILKPKGTICIRTTNRYGYVAMVSSLIPNKLHSKVLHKVQDGRKEEDVFPTYYRCNTRGKLKRKFTENGLEPYVFTHEPEPAYLNFSSIAYSAGVIYQKLVPDLFKHFIFAFGIKK